MIVIDFVVDDTAPRVRECLRDIALDKSYYDDDDDDDDD